MDSHAAVDDGQDAKRAVVQFVGRDVSGEVNVSGEVSGAQSRWAVHIWRAAFFPGLDPVLNGGERDEHAVITPQMPTRRLVGQAVRDDESHGQGNDAVGEMGLGQGVVRRIRVEESVALGAAVLRVAEFEIAGFPRHEVARIVETTSAGAISKTRFAAPGAREMRVVAAASNDLGFEQIYGACDPLGGVWRILAGAEHDDALLGKMSSA
jgi:hypothetical protein